MGTVDGLRLTVSWTLPVGVGGLMVPAPSCSGAIPAPVFTTPLAAG